MTGPFQRRRRRQRTAVVGALALLGPAPALDIAQTAGLNSGQVYPILRWLQNEGIVKRVKHDDGRWKFGYVLTELPPTFTVPSPADTVVRLIEEYPAGAREAGPGEFFPPQTPPPLLVRAIADPGAFTARVLEFSEPRWEGDSPGIEPLSLWQARAVVLALELRDMDERRVQRD